MQKNIETWWTLLDDTWKTIFYQSLNMVLQNSKYFNNPNIESLEHKIMTIRKIRKKGDFQALLKLTPYITHLYLNDRKLNDISPLIAFKNLEFLDLRNNNIDDITVLQDLKSLETLWLGENPTIDRIVLDKLPNLRVVSVN
jgi:Leucine-rich repeat (LRR) protein